MEWIHTADAHRVKCYAPSALHLTTHTSKNLGKNSTIAIKITFEFLNCIRFLYNYMIPAVRFQIICFGTQSELENQTVNWRNEQKFNYKVKNKFTAIDGNFVYPDFAFVKRIKKQQLL